MAQPSLSAEFVCAERSPVVVLEAMDFLKLLELPESSRDQAWEHTFLEQFISTNVEVAKDEPQLGPDGWPYLLVRTGRGEEPIVRVVEFLYTRGVGLAVNTHKMVPDYVFTYGMIWNFAETGKFVMVGAQASGGEIILSPGEKVISGEPSPKFLPPYVRSILKSFLQAQGFQQPKVAALTSDNFKTVDLVFSLESLGGLAPDRHASLAQDIGWFLPLHYTLMIESEANVKGFVDL